jgi:hypothetical protein
MVKEGNAGGYKRGGKVHHKAVGGMIPDESSYGSYASTKVDEAGAQHEHGPTGGVKEEQGGYKRGGHTKKHHYAKGGNVMNYVNDNVDGTPAGVTNMTTGGVREGNAGGFKHGGKTSKKAYATGGRVNDSGRPVALKPRGVGAKPAPPVAINMLSGTYKKGGSVDSGNKGLQNVFKKENATNLSESKKDTALKYDQDTYQGQKIPAMPTMKKHGGRA